MVLLGIILLLIGIGLGTAAFIGAADEAQTIQLSALGFTRDVPPIELIVIGMLAMLLFALGWALVAGRARRRGRVRREEREAERIADIERSAESERLEQERRFEEARLRDDDLRIRDEELGTRARDLDSREQDLARREAEWREHTGPSVADVVTGRAQGRVSEGTAQWSGDESARPADETRQMPRTDGDADSRA